MEKFIPREGEEDFGLWGHEMGHTKNKIELGRRLTNVKSITFIQTSKQATVTTLCGEGMSRSILR